MIKLGGKCTDTVDRRTVRRGTRFSSKAETSTLGVVGNAEELWGVLNV